MKPENENCIFCKIVAGEIPAEKISETDKTISFLDINPVTPGHLLVIPKDHHEWMDTTPDDILSAVFTEAKHLMNVQKEALVADFVAVSVIGTDVPHFHVHLIPRHFNDGLKAWPGKGYAPNEKEETAEKIKKALT